MRGTHTLAILRVPPAALAEVRARIDRVNQHHDYDHMLMDDGCLDMHGIALQADPADEVTPNYDATEAMVTALVDEGIIMRDDEIVDIGTGKSMIERLAKAGYTLQRVAQITAPNILPALVRPGMYAGERGDRAKEQWQADAVAAYLQPGGVQMR